MAEPFPAPESLTQRYRKVPVVIDAVQLTWENRDEVAEWCDAVVVWSDADHILIKTLEGTMNAHIGDWVIRGVKGEFYPCKPDIFASTYEAEPEV